MSIICQDIVHLYARSHVSPRCLFKIDLQKAYDTVEWDFVEQLLSGLNFPTHFTNLVMACIKSTSFTLVLNGNNFGYFKGKRGLRQGDPISPLIFTICMEYLTRLIAFATERWPFHYHPLCKSLKLTHLMFADDLLMFCKGDAPSILLLMKAFTSFSNASGLRMNNTKSEIFFSGMVPELKSDILRVTGFQEGTMPFRYLGVPIQPGKLSKKDCSCLTEKIIRRIRGLGAKKLSYAGRITLINSVLNTLHTYWATMFLIPKAVLRRIEAICRNYLWDGSPDYHRVPLVAWDKITMPKDAGGLGIKKVEYWNWAAVGKLVNWMYSKADRLWIRWIGNVYLKNQDWHSYSSPADSPWTWKNIYKTKEKLKEGFVENCWVSDEKGYTLKNGYKWLCNQQPKEDWCSLVWNNWNIPKHSIITWLIMQEGLNLKTRLHQFGFCEDNLCLFCGELPETMAHLFYECTYSCRIRAAVATWLGRSFPSLNELQNGRETSIQWKAMTMVFNVYLYTIWYQRNTTRLQYSVQRPEYVAQQIEDVAGKRGRSKAGPGLWHSTNDWISLP